MISRRKFIHISGLSAAAVLTGPKVTIGSEVRLAKKQFEIDKVQPTEYQKAWMKLKYGMFIHFGPNTISGTGWGDGKFPAKDVVFPPIGMA